MPETSRHSLAIVGAGPVGLEAAAHAVELGFDVHVFERGDVGAHAIAWGHVRMFTPWRMNVGPASARLLAKHGWSAPVAEALTTIVTVTVLSPARVALLPEIDADLPSGAICATPLPPSLVDWSVTSRVALKG